MTKWSSGFNVNEVTIDWHWRERSSLPQVVLAVNSTGCQNTISSHSNILKPQLPIACGKERTLERLALQTAVIYIFTSKNVTQKVLVSQD